jgi:hypothetical protein
MNYTTKTTCAKGKDTKSISVSMKKWAKSKEKQQKVAQ